MEFTDKDGASTKMSQQKITDSGHHVPLSPTISDEVKTTTCYMCACRCGIKVHLKDGEVRYIEGNPDHPVNEGVLCAKGSSGIMQHVSPARLKKPLRRVGPRGSNEFEEIEWDEALDLAEKWLSDVRKSDPKKLAFFTGRDQSQSLTGWWAAKFGTPNYAAHGGFCSVNMAAGGLYSIGGSFWEFGEVDWEKTKYFLMFGIAEDHDSNPIKIGLGKLKGRGDAKFVSVNPVRTGYSAIADEWLGIRPGSDGLFVASLIHLLMHNDKLDFEYLGRYTNASHLVIDEADAPDNGLFLRDDKGDALLYDLTKGEARSIMDADTTPALTGNWQVMGRSVTPSLEIVARRFLSEDYAPENVEEETGISADTIRRIADEIATAAFDDEIEVEQSWTDAWGRTHDKMVGRPVSMHAMRGISAHSNGFHTCRLLHLLQTLIGAIDRPGGFLYKPPFPKPCPPGPKPAGKGAMPNTPIAGIPLGFPQSPEDLLIEQDGTPTRIDKGFSWDYPLSAHGLMHMVIHNAHKGDPYPIDVLFMYMANMSWNSSMNIKDTLHYLTDTDEQGRYKIPHIIYSDAYSSEMIHYADLILPDTTYLERWDCISLLDRPISNAHGPADSIRQPVINPNRDGIRDVRPFQDVVIELGARLKLPGFVDDDGTALYKGGYADYLVNHERTPGIGPLAGWRGDDGNEHGKGAVNKSQLDKYIANGCYWHKPLDKNMRYYRNVNKDYLAYAQSMGWVPTTAPIMPLLYSETLQKFRLAAMGHGEASKTMPDHVKERIETYFDPVPLYYSPFEIEATKHDYPLYALTQRPMHMYHSWGSQNAWLRQITTENYLYISHDLAKEHGLKKGDWAWLESRIGRIRVQVKPMHGVEKNTVWTWNAIGKRRGAWGLDNEANESNVGFLLNHLIPENLKGNDFSNADPVTGQAAWYDLRVKIEKCDLEEIPQSSPQFEPLKSFGVGADASYDKKHKILRYGQQFKNDHEKGDNGKGLPMTEWVGRGSKPTLSND